MAERHRSQTHAVLDELVAVHVPDVTALAPDDEPRRLHGELIVPLGIRVSPAGDEAMGTLRQLRAARAFREVPRSGFRDRLKERVFGHRKPLRGRLPRCTRYRV